MKVIDNLILAVSIVANNFTIRTAMDDPGWDNILGAAFVGVITLLGGAKVYAETMRNIRPEPKV